MYESVLFDDEYFDMIEIYATYIYLWHNQ